MLKISAFYLDIQKSVIPKKDLKLPWIALFSAKRWRLDFLTFFIHGFEQNKEKFVDSGIVKTCDELDLWVEEQWVFLNHLDRIYHQLQLPGLETFH